MPVEALTFGCRLNAAESEAMRVVAEAAGHRDLVIVNSCAVTAEAVRQARKAVRKTARDRPGARVVVTGCAAQIEPDTFAAMPEVHSVLGNGEKVNAEIWRRLGQDADRVQVGDIMGVGSAAPTVPGREVGRTRALVQVQNGCDHRCTFCVIPFGRGNSRSVPVEIVTEQVVRLVGEGAREVVLTGVDVTSYGADLSGAPRLGSLVKAILAAAPDLARLRLSSIDSIEADEGLIEAIATEPRLMPHLHLSLQSGSDMVLKRMKRRHSRADSVEFCARMRRLRPDIVFGADLIAGFPTESHAMFRDTLALVSDCSLTFLHVFPYSRRPGTPASRMPPVPPEVVKDRAAQLREAGAAALKLYLDREMGRRRQVLTENGDVGRTEGFAPVRFQAPIAAGQIVEAIITAHDGRQLIAA